MATISKSGITTGQLIAPAHITNIIDALDGTTVNNIVFAGPVTGSAPISASAGFTGSLSGTASYATTSSYAITTPNLNGQAANYYLNASNINAGTLGNAYLPSAINVGSVTASFTGSFTGPLTGTASWANNASAMVFGGLSSLPASLAGANNGGVSSVTLTDSATKSNWTASLSGDFTLGRLNYCNSATSTINILLDGGSLTSKVGSEYSFFWLTGSNDIIFNAGTGTTIVSENGYTKMYSTGSIVTAKYIGNIPFGGGNSDVFILVGSLKA